MTLSGATTPGQSRPGSNGNEDIVHISQSSSITVALLSDSLILFAGHSLVRWSYPSAEMQTVYSTVQANWASYNCYTNYYHLIRILETINLGSNDSY